MGITKCSCRKLQAKCRLCYSSLFVLLGPSADLLGMITHENVYLIPSLWLTQAGPYNTPVQAQHRKIEQLEGELRTTKLQLAESNAVQSEALQRAANLQQELENNAGQDSFLPLCMHTACSCQ